MLNIKIILGSTRPSRFSEKPGEWIYEMTKKQTGARGGGQTNLAEEEIGVELLDLRDYPLPFFDEPTSPAMVEDGAYANEVAVKWADKIREGDAFIVVTPEYNHGTSGVLKNALDHIWAEWNKKPVGFVAYGNAGGARAVEQLRQVVVELEMAPIRRAVHIQSPWDLLTENGELKAGALDPYQKSAEKFINQLVWWARALKAARDQKK